MLTEIINKIIVILLKDEKKKKKIILKNPVTVKKENHLLLKNKKEMFTLKEENFFFESDGALRGRSLKAFAVSVAAAIAGQCHSAVVSTSTKQLAGHSSKVLLADVGFSLDVGFFLSS